MLPPTDPLLRALAAVSQRAVVSTVKAVPYRARN